MVKDKKQLFDFKVLAKIFGLIAAFSAVGFLLITIAYTLPRGRIRSHVAESVTWYNVGHEWGYKLWQTRSDTFSDAFRLSIAAGPNENPVRSAALSLRNASLKETDNIHGEIYALYGDENYENLEVVEREYGRYWHGYVIFLAPLLTFLNPAEINVLDYGIQFIAIIALLFIAYKKYGAKLALAVAFYVYALNPVTTASCLQYAPGFYLSILPMILILLFHEKLSAKGRYALLFAFIGCAINFFDLLSFPLVTLGAPVALSVYLDNRDKAQKIGQQFCKIIMRSGCWVLGYGITWVLKWTIATLVTGENMFANAIEAIFNRSGGGGYSRFSAISRNMEVMFNVPTIIICVLILVVILVMWWRKKITINLRDKKLLLLAFVAIYPFIWYCTLVNHSWVHTFMAHRLLAISMFCVALGIAQSSSLVVKKVTRISSSKKKTRG